MAQFSVHPRFNFKALRITDGRLMYNDRAHRACRIEAFADKKLFMFLLQIARCYIIYNCIAEYMIKRMFFGDVRSAFDMITASSPS